MRTDSQTKMNIKNSPRGNSKLIQQTSSKLQDIAINQQKQDGQLLS